MTELSAGALAAIIDRFVAKMVRDPMIGFFFAKVDTVRLAQLEYEHAAELLGIGEVRYSGRTLRAAHAPHRIMGGQFARRREILRQVLVAHDVPAEIQARWLAGIDALREEITRDPGSECR
jgi:hemoglobin